MTEYKCEVPGCPVPVRSTDWDCGKWLTDGKKEWETTHRLCSEHRTAVCAFARDELNTPAHTTHEQFAAFLARHAVKTWDAKPGDYVRGKETGTVYKIDPGELTATVVTVGTKDVTVGETVRFQKGNCEPWVPRVGERVEWDESGLLLLGTVTELIGGIKPRIQGDTGAKHAWGSIDEWRRDFNLRPSSTPAPELNPKCKACGYGGVLDADGMCASLPQCAINVDEARRNGISLPDPYLAQRRLEQHHYSGCSKDYRPNGKPLKVEIADDFREAARKNERERERERIRRNGPRILLSGDFWKL